MLTLIILALVAIGPLSMLFMAGAIIKQIPRVRYGLLRIRANRRIGEWSSEGAAAALTAPGDTETRLSALSYLILTLPDEELIGLLRRTISGADEALLLRAVKAVGDREFRVLTSDLLGLMKHHASGEVRRAACESLGRVGDKAVVEAILEYRRRLRPLNSAKVTARAAIEAIQSRILLPEEGTLSLSGEESKGTLDYAEDEGALELVPIEARNDRSNEGP